MKAIVFKHEYGGTYVLDREGSFSFINGYTSHSVGDEIEIKSQPIIYLKRISSIAACLILLLSLGLFMRLWTQTSHFVYVDINPSIELQFNRFDRLRTATPLNDDGGVLLGNIDLRGASDKIIVDIINEAIEQGFLVAVDGKPGVLITVVAAGGSLPDAQISAINLALERNGMDGFTVVGTGSMVLKGRAEVLGVSPGRLQLAEAAEQASGGLTPLEDLLGKRIEELFDVIEDANGEHSGGPADPRTTPIEYSESNPDTSQTPESSGPERHDRSPARADIPLSTGAGPADSPGASQDNSPGNTNPGNPPATGSQANDPAPGEPSANTPQPNPSSGSGNSSGNSPGNDPCNANNPCGLPDCNSCNTGSNGSGAQPNPNVGPGNNSGNNPCNANNPCGLPGCNRCNKGNGNNGNNPCNANNPCGLPDCNRCNKGNGNNGNNPCNANNPCGLPDCNSCNKGNGITPNNGNSPNSGNNPCNANNPCGLPDCNSCSKGNSKNGNTPCNANNPCGLPDCNSCSKGNAKNGNTPCNANNPCGEPDCNSCSKGNGNNGNNPCNANNPCGEPDCNSCSKGNGNNGKNPCNANNPCGEPDCNSCNKGNGNNGKTPCNANNPCGLDTCNSCSPGKGNGNGNGNGNGKTPCNANNPCGLDTCNSCSSGNGKSTVALSAPASEPEINPGSPGSPGIADNPCSELEPECEISNASTDSSG